MKGQAEIIDGLNGALTVEPDGNHQSIFCQSKMCADWGFHNLAKKHYEESIGEMKHAEKLIERILFLEGVPEIRALRRHPGGHRREGAVRERPEARNAGRSRATTR